MPGRDCVHVALAPQDSWEQFLVENAWDAFYAQCRRDGRIPRLPKRKEETEDEGSNSSRSQQQVGMR
jgi:hypothetical protein